MADQSPAREMRGRSSRGSPHTALPLLLPLLPTRVSEGVRRRAYEAAHVLLDEFDDRLTRAQHAIVDRILQRGPDHVGWLDVFGMHILYDDVVEVRW